MRLVLASLLSALLVATSTSTASAQLLVAKEGPVVYGHHHINATNIDAQKKFFADTLGGKAIKFGPNNADVVEFPNVLVFFRMQAPTGGSIGTTVNHIGFSVPNVRETVAKVKAAGYKVITRSEVAPTQEVKDDVAAINPNVTIAFVLGPDDVKVELVENKQLQQTLPIMLHHLHFFNTQNAEMQAWYVKTFGAKARQAPNFPAADLPGVALNFSPSTTPVVGTQNRALDHIGFEVKDLEAFCKKLEADGIKFAVPYRKIEAMNLAIAFITDPWGTYIELTEGLDKIG